MNCTYYTFDGKQYPSFPISEEDIISSVEKAGFKIRFKNCYYKPEHLIKSNMFSDTSGKAFFVVQT